MGITTTSAALLADDRILREPLALVVAISGPSGAGKTLVARTLAGPDAARSTCWLMVEDMIVRLRAGHEMRDRAMEEPDTLVVDDIDLGDRPRTRAEFVALVARRASAGRRTFLVEGKRDGSFGRLVHSLPEDQTQWFKLRGRRPPTLERRVHHDP